MSEAREMTLKEWCAKLPDLHLVNRELHALEAQLERVRGLPMRQLIQALRVASDALEIAADWNVVNVQVWPPEAWNLPAYDEDAAEGWCSTQALSERLGKVADELEAALCTDSSNSGEVAGEDAI